MPDYTLADGFTVKNLLGACSFDELEKRQVEPTRRRIVQIELGHGPKGQFDAEHLKAFHRHIFQDVFEWAGHTRDEHVRLSDGTTATEPNLRKIDGKSFLQGSLIPALLRKISQHLGNADYLRGIPRDQFAQQAADVLIELNQAHPFREGNGRTQRVFMRELAKHAGHNLDFSVVSKERMIQASIAANERDDSSMMRRMFDEISDPVRVVLLREAIDKLQGAFNEEAEQGKTSRKPTDWNDYYVATVTAGHEGKLRFVRAVGNQFMSQASNDHILFGKAADLPNPHPARGETFNFKGSAWSQEGLGAVDDQPMQAIDLTEFRSLR